MGRAQLLIFRLSTQVLIVYLHPPTLQHTLSCHGLPTSNPLRWFVSQTLDSSAFWLSLSWIVSLLRLLPLIRGSYREEKHFEMHGKKRARSAWLYAPPALSRATHLLVVLGLCSHCSDIHPSSHAASVSVKCLSEDGWAFHRNRSVAA